MTQIGKNIKKIRNVKGISQQAFADLFQLSRGNISSYEELRAEPKIEVIVKIANYFGIPVGDFIEKELSINELLHYNSQLVLETDKLKMTQHMATIPFIPAIHLQDYLKEYVNEDFFSRLPYITAPVNSLSRLIALELDNPEILPAGFNFTKGDILIFEYVSRENVHRLPGKLGIMINPEGLKSGKYILAKDKISLVLNDFIQYPFSIDSENQYWILRGYYMQQV